MFIPISCKKVTSKPYVSHGITYGVKQTGFTLSDEIFILDTSDCSVEKFTRTDIISFLQSKVRIKNLRLQNGRLGVKNIEGLSDISIKDCPIKLGNVEVTLMKGSCLFKLFNKFFFVSPYRLGGEDCLIINGFCFLSPSTESIKKVDRLAVSGKYLREVPLEYDKHPFLPKVFGSKTDTNIPKVFFASLGNELPFSSTHTMLSSRETSDKCSLVANEFSWSDEIGLIVSYNDFKIYFLKNKVVGVFCYDYFLNFSELNWLNEFGFCSEDEAKASLAKLKLFSN